MAMSKDMWPEVDNNSVTLFILEPVNGGRGLVFLILENRWKTDGVVISKFE